MIAHVGAQPIAQRVENPLEFRKKGDRSPRADDYRRMQTRWKATAIAGLLALVAGEACVVRSGGSNDDDDGIIPPPTMSTGGGGQTAGAGGAGGMVPTAESLFIDVPGGTFVGAAVPEPSAEANSPALDNGSGPDTLINGGSGLFDVGYSDPDGANTVSHLVVAAEGDAGYFELPLDGSGTSMTTVTIKAEVDAPSLTVGFAVVDGTGLASNYWTTTFDLVQTGTGDVKVTLSFDRDVDVDLHVVEPSGEDVYFGNTTSETGGELDLDSNAGCSIDGVNNENIFWADGSAPSGTYTVRVDYYDACETGPVNYVVTVHNGPLVDTYTGSFTEADADAGGEGSGRTITTFTY